MKSFKNLLCEGKKIKAVIQTKGEKTIIVNSQIEVETDVTDVDFRFKISNGEQSVLNKYSAKMSSEYENFVKKIESILDSCASDLKKAK